MTWGYHDDLPASSSVQEPGGGPQRGSRGDLGRREEQFGLRRRLPAVNNAGLRADTAIKVRPFCLLKSAETQWPRNPVTFPVKPAPRPPVPPPGQLQRSEVHPACRGATGRGGGVLRRWASIPTDSLATGRRCPEPPALPRGPHPPSGRKGGPALPLQTPALELRTVEPVV